MMSVKFIGVAADVNIKVVDICCQKVSRPEKWSYKSRMLKPQRSEDTSLAPK